MGLNPCCGKAFLWGVEVCDKKSLQCIGMVLKAITFSSNKSFVSSQDAKMFSLEMNDATPMNLILTSPDKAYGLNNLNTDVNIYVSNVFLFFCVNSQAMLTPSRGGEKNVCCVFIIHTMKWPI